MQFDAHTRGKHGQRVGDALVAEWVEVHDRDVRGRQTCQIGRTSRCGIDRYVVGAGATGPQVTVPADYRAGATPQWGIGELDHASGGESVVKFGHGQKLEGDMRSTAVTGQQRQRSAQSATGAGALNGDAFRVDA